MKVTFRQLQVFDAVASLGSIVRAAEALNMSQSAASAALKDLQLALGRQPLFHRAGRGLLITTEGKRLQPRVRSLLNELKEVENPSAAARLEGTVTVGVTDTEAYVLPRLAVAFRARHPGVRINLVVGLSQEIVAQLTSFAIDLVMTDSMTRAPGVLLTEIYRERSVWIAHPHHPLAARDEVSFADLEAVEWCMPGRSSLTNLRLNDAVRGHIANFNVAMEINRDEGVREAVKAGAGISLLPFSLVAADLAAGRLVELPMGDFGSLRPTYLVRMKDVKSTPPAQAFASFILESFTGA